MQGTIQAMAEGVKHAPVDLFQMHQGHASVVNALLDLNQ